MNMYQQMILSVLLIEWENIKIDAFECEGIEEIKCLKKIELKNKMCTDVSRGFLRHGVSTD